MSACSRPPAGSCRSNAGLRGNVRTVARIRTLGAALLAALAMPVSTAGASAYSQVLQSYERNGTIPPCVFSSAELASALNGVDTYGAQYFADFTDAITSALTARAGGACVAAHAAAPAAPPGSGQALTGELQIGSLTAATAAGVPLPIVLMALLAACGALAVALGGVLRRRGADPAWLAGWRHAWGEAAYRVGGAWAGFVDWLRSA